VKNGWYGESECFSGFQVDDHFEGCRLDDWEIGRFLAFEDAMAQKRTSVERSSWRSIARGPMRSAPQVYVFADEVIE
jgi:hypothetical protein